MRTPMTTTLVIAAALLAGCSEYSPAGQPSATLTAAVPSETPMPTDTPAATPTADATQAPAPDAVTLGAATVSGALGSEPQVAINTKAKPAAKLLTADIAVGDGAAVAAGATVTAHYVGYGASTGQMFDSSWQRGDAATFPLDQVIVGWQDGLVGMKVGGRRVLVIPATQGYGDNPPEGAGILPGETLVFVVDLVGVS